MSHQFKAAHNTDSMDHSTKLLKEKTSAVATQLTSMPFGLPSPLLLALEEFVSSRDIANLLPR